MSSNSPDDYEVGKGKPPVEHQFKPGQSGNPQGRPKGSKNVHQVLTKILGEKIAITESGKKMVVSKLEGAMRVLVNKSFEGKPQSLKLLLQVFDEAGGGSHAPTENPFSEDDYASLVEELDWIEKVRDAMQKEQPNGSE